MIDYPNPPSGTGALMNFYRRLVAAGRANRILNGTGYKVREGTNGSFLEILPGGGKAISIETYHFKFQLDDYFVARSWDGTTEGDTDINVAKPPLLRHTITTRTIRGIVVTYRYNSEQRIALPAGGVEEVQYPTPDYAPGDLIYAVSAETFVKTEEEEDVTLLDLNLDGRAWAAANT